MNRRRGITLLGLFRALAVLAGVAWVLSPLARRIRHDWTAARRAQRLMALTSRLVEAAVAGDTPKAMRLLDHGADINARAGIDTPLTAAIANHHVETVRALLERGAGPHTGRGGEETPLALAATGGDIAIVDLLLQHGAGRNQRELNGALLSVGDRGQPAIVRMLVARGGNPNARTGGPTPLTTASGHGRKDAVAALLDAGADPNLQDETGHTPLCAAVDLAKFEVVQVLLSRGADPSVPDADGDTPLVNAVRYHGRTEETARDLDRIVKLLRSGAPRAPVHPTQSHTEVTIYRAPRAPGVDSEPVVVMHPFKIELFEREHPGAHFPAFEPASATAMSALRQRIAERLGIAADHGLELVQHVWELSRPLEGVDAEADDFDLSEVIKRCGIAVPGPVLLDWLQFDDTESMRLADLSDRLSDIWFPGSDDLCIFDDTLTWFLFISHYGALQLARLPGELPAADPPD